jgi:uncharacterized membrane protein (DUF2068 family)
VDWSLFVCARKGHLTYAPDEPGLRDRLMAPTVAGTAWRCLRCGAFVTGEPHDSGPAAAAPLVRRGQELRGELILRVFAVERFFRFLILGAAAYGVWRFKYDRAGIQRTFNNALPMIRGLYTDLGFNISHSKLLPFIQHSFTYTSRWLTLLAIGLAVYAVVELAESIGLWLARRWGEYLAMVATSVFLPLEIWDLARGRITWLKVAAFVINLLLVIYLVWSRRLFGVRGGKTAYEARLRSASVIEVEQAALLAATPTQPGHDNLASAAPPGHPDPGHPDPGQPDPGRSDPGRSDPGRSDPGRSDPSQPVSAAVQLTGNASSSARSPSGASSPRSPHQSHPPHTDADP